MCKYGSREILTSLQSVEARKDLLLVACSGRSPHALKHMRHALCHARCGGQITAHGTLIVNTRHFERPIYVGRRGMMQDLMSEIFCTHPTPMNPPRIRVCPSILLLQFRHQHQHRIGGTHRCRTRRASSTSAAFERWSVSGLALWQRVCSDIQKIPSALSDLSCSLSQGWPQSTQGEGCVHCAALSRKGMIIRFKNLKLAGNYCQQYRF